MAIKVAAKKGRSYNCNVCVVFSACSQLASKNSLNHSLIRYVLQCLGENSISDADMKQMIHNADYDNDGKVSLEDFRRMWKEY